MDFLISAFQALLSKPLFNALILLYDYLPGHDFGIAVIVLTIAIRIILYPLMVQSIKSQKTIQDLQPKIQEIQQKFKGDKEKQARETMSLYQKEKINPFGGCLPILLQLPILIALYQVFWQGLKPEAMADLYNFIPNPGIIDPTFLGLIDLSRPVLALAFLAGIIQFLQSKMITPQQKTSSGVQGKQGQAGQFSNIMQKQMLYFFPIFTVLILWKLPSAIGLYWIVTGLFSIFQQYLIYRPQAKTSSNIKQ